MAGKKKPDRLALEAQAALAAGMSYGKWKAAIYERQNRKPAERPIYTDDEFDTVCVSCGEPYVRGTYTGKYCPKCRARRNELCTPSMS